MSYAVLMPLLLEEQNDSMKLSSSVPKTIEVSSCIYGI
jgi:hypothetical protein